MDTQNAITDETVATDTTPANENPATPEPSLRDTIAAAFKANSAPEKQQETKSVADRARDASGKFTKADTQPEKTEAPKAQAPVEGTQPPELAKAETQAPVTAPAIKAPAGWSAESKAAFDALPEFVKADIVRREENVDKGFAKYKGLDRHVQAFTEMGVDLAQAIDNYRAAEDHIANNGAIGYVQLMQQFGHDPADIARQILGVPNTEQGRQQPGAAPLNPQLLSKISELEAKFATVQNHFNGERLSKAEAEAEAFLKDPANAHAEAVIDDMVALITAARSQGTVLSFKDAYDKAVWARPDIRQKLMDEQIKAHEAKRTKELAEAAQKAKQAASSVTGSPLPNGRSGAAQSSNSVREDIIAAMQEARGRA